MFYQENVLNFFSVFLHVEIDYLIFIFSSVYKAYHLFDLYMLNHFCISGINSYLVMAYECKSVSDSVMSEYLQPHVL